MMNYALIAPAYLYVPGLYLEYCSFFIDFPRYFPDFHLIFFRFPNSIKIIRKTTRAPSDMLLSAINILILREDIAALCYLDKQKKKMGIVGTNKTIFILPSFIRRTEQFKKKGFSNTISVENKDYLKQGFFITYS